ncbi:pentapeptide repeat-containing protein [Paenibacillus shenyangensis]|uniref:pentapeptide repeat-containing protein n=1 Tax=Paenibacillus sp. A9 TaxID=1284352 RepID=UPI00037EA243|nr:pentapeptide repeat-containing protein [Paenibacillus sp. A9]
MDNFIQCCSYIRQQQLDGYKGKIHYITYSLLRTGLLDGQPAYLIQAADEHWMLDQHSIEYEYKGDCIFQYWHQLLDRIVREADAAGWKISEFELDNIRLEEADCFHQVLISVLRKAMRQAVKQPEYIELKRALQVEIRAGEYLDQSVCIYKENRNEMDGPTVHAWLAEKQMYAYGYQDIHNVVLSMGDYSELDFRYTTFRHVNASVCRFSFGVLAGTNWRDCMLDGVTFAFSMIHGADFSGCMLRNSTLDGVMGAAGSSELDWEVLGFDRVCFTGANLSGSTLHKASLYRACFRDSVLEQTNFTAADLRQADFSGAIMKDAVLQEADLSGACLDHCDLTGVSFTGANLQGASLIGAIVDQTDFAGALLSPEQLSRVVIRDHVTGERGRLQ